MFCPNCGAKKQEKAKFCKECGCELGVLSSEESKRRLLSRWLFLGAAIIIIGVIIAVIILPRYITNPPLFQESSETASQETSQKTLKPTNTELVTPPYTPSSTATLTSTYITSQTPVPSLTPTPKLGIGSTQVSPVDAMTMVYVPKGDFIMGSEDVDDDGSPVHTVYLDAFWIDQTEITNSMFSQFVFETGHITQAEKEGWSWDYYDGQWHKTYGADWRHPDGLGDSIQGLEDHPVLRVSWDDAKAYCNWADRRLPTEAEWEKAARGIDGRLYPWGNAPPSDSLLNYKSNVGTTTTVGSYPLGASPYGTLDMAGNVWEWVADWYTEEYYSSSPYENPLGPPTGLGRAMRGGSWFWGNWGGETIQIAYRQWGYQDASYWSTGFRCACSELAQDAYSTDLVGASVTPAKSLTTGDKESVMIITRNWEPDWSSSYKIFDILMSFLYRK